MNTKKLLFILIIAFITSCNTSPKRKTSEKKVPEYSFAIPKGWTTEKFPFPPPFASQISYTGFEDIRFATGWENVSSEEHWTYTFLWWLEGTPKIDAAILQENLQQYYTGLIEKNVRERHIAADKLIPVVTNITQTETAESDIETYTGTITMLDYLDITYKPVTLNCQIHKKNCSSQTAIIFEISPQSFEHALWQQLKQLNADFHCK